MKKGFYNFVELINPFVHMDQSKQRSANELLAQVPLKNKVNILDLGCGEGGAINVKKITEKNPHSSINHFGLDVTNNNVNPNIFFVLYDGTQMPFKKSSFDIVFCNQVLEHVRYPDVLIKEVFRVLKGDGFFIGSVSHTEPYHAFSIFNWTPYGLVEVFKSAGFQNITLFPGIDSITLLIRRLTLGKLGNYYFSHESPINHLFTLVGKTLGMSKKETTILKLSFCGQFSFCAKQ